MRKLGAVLALALLLCGCGAEETFETIADNAAVQTVLAEPMEIYVVLPEEAILPAMESDTGKIYICRDYDVCVQTLDGGDLEQTIQTLCGYSSDDITVMEMQEDGWTRYEFVWTSAGELGDQVGRAVILDDGSYHYCVSAMINEEKAGQFQEYWNGMFESFTLT